MFKHIGSVIFRANEEPGMYSNTSRFVSQLCSAYTSVQLYCQRTRGYALPRKYLRNSSIGCILEGGGVRVGSRTPPWKKIHLVALFPSSKASFLPMRGLDSHFGGHFHNVGGGAFFLLV